MYKRTFKQLMGITIVVLLFTGCAVRQNLLTTENYRKELVPHGQTSFSGVWAIEDGGKLKVAGTLRPRGIMRANIPDYVEVALLDRSGAIIAAQKVAYYPRHPTGRKHSRKATFFARFAEMPPAGTTVRISNVN